MYVMDRFLAPCSHPRMLYQGECIDEEGKKLIDNWLLTPSQPRRSYMFYYQGDEEGEGRDIEDRQLLLWSAHAVVSSTVLMEHLSSLACVFMARTDRFCWCPLIRLVVRSARIRAQPHPAMRQLFLFAADWIHL